MPIITMDGPPVNDPAKKRTMVEEITRRAAAFYGLPAEAIIILIKENRSDNVALGGTLISDRPKP
ncbi:MAG: tautomerase family protein [Deltaproteobacteria bacterium]|nr:tautomerase family protein [Deltaproteobacteria bacterium]